MIIFPRWGNAVFGGNDSLTHEMYMEAEIGILPEQIVNRYQKKELRLADKSLQVG